MATLSVPEPQAWVALKTCQSALRRFAGYTLDPALDQKMRDLGENKEFLTPSDHDELMALVAFTQQRTVEKLEAELALRQLEAAYPELVGDS